MRKTVEYYEALLRRLRRHPHLCDEGPKADQVGKLIDAIKQRCAPAWQERVRRNQNARLERWFALQ